MLKSNLKIRIPEAKLRELAAEGFTIPQMAELLGVSYTTIKHRLISLNIPYQQPSFALQVTPEALYNRYVDGGSVKDMAVEYHVSNTAIRNRIEQYRRYLQDQLDNLQRRKSG